LYSLVSAAYTAAHYMHYQFWNPPNSKQVYYRQSLQFHLVSFWFEVIPVIAITNEWKQGQHFKDQSRKDMMLEGSGEATFIILGANDPTRI
jgi:hypothetical protein